MYLTIGYRLGGRDVKEFLGVVRNKQGGPVSK